MTHKPSRPLVIFVLFQIKTGHEHPHLQAAISNYSALLQAMGRSEDEIRAELEAVRREAAGEGF